MTHQSRIVCQNHFKSLDEDTAKAEFSRKIALLFERAERIPLNDEENLIPEIKERISQIE